MVGNPPTYQCAANLYLIFRDFSVGVPVRLSSSLSWKPSSSSWCEAGGRLRPEECRRQSALQRLSTSSSSLPSSPSQNWPLANYDQQKIPLIYPWPFLIHFKFYMDHLNLVSLCVLAGDIFAESKRQTFRTQYFERNGFWDWKKINRDIFSGFINMSQNFAPQDPTLIMIWSE